MKEFNKVIDAENINGLRFSEIFPRNAGKLQQSLNAIPTKYGLESYELIINPIINCPAVSWPFPQLYIGKYHQLLLTGDKLYSINNNWTLTLELDMSSYYNLNPSASYSIWHIADFYNYIIISNNHLVITYDTTTNTFNLHSASTSMPLFTTITNFNGQAVAGNITSSWYGAGDNGIIWSKIGELDFLPDGMNTSGIYTTPWIGEVLKVLPLANGVVVYCEDGILFMEPVEQYWSFTVLTDYGIYGRGAVDGDSYTHLFIDKAGYVRKLTSDKQINKLGYQEYIQPILDVDIVVSFIENENRFSISNGEFTYIVTEAGMGESSQIITSAKFYDEGVIGIVKNASSLDYIITTNLIDMNIRSLKTLTMIEFGIDTDTEAYVAVDYRYSKSSSFITSSWIRLNKEGVAYVPIVGVEFRIKLKCENYVSVNLDYINIRFKVTDRRFRRGAYNVS